MGVRTLRTGEFAHVRAVTFDLGGTLVRPDTHPTTGQVAHVLDMSLDDARTLMSEIAKRRIVAPRDLAAELAGRYRRRALIGPLTQVLEEARRRAATPELYQDAFPVLELLRARGFALYGMSNALGSSIPESPPAFHSLLDAVFASAETGVCKPEREAFAIVERAQGLSPDQLLHVGDSVRADVGGALAAGWHTVHLDRSGIAEANTVPRHVPRLRSLTGLAHLLPTHV